MPKAEVEIRSTSSVAQEPASERVKFTEVVRFRWLKMIVNLTQTCFAETPPQDSVIAFTLPFQEVGIHSLDSF